MKCLLLQLALVGVLIFAVSGQIIFETDENQGGNRIQMRPVQRQRPQRPQRQQQIPQNFPQFDTDEITSTTTAPTVRTTPTQAFFRCIAACPSTQQYNPVCGSDNQNYHNVYRLECAQRCGAAVSMVRIGTCMGL